MPEFAEAHMVDGDLVGAQMDDMHSSWNRQRETILSPIPFLSTGAQAIAAVGGVKITVHLEHLCKLCVRIGLYVTIDIEG